MSQLGPMGLRPGPKDRLSGHHLDAPRPSLGPTSLADPLALPRPRGVGVAVLLLASERSGRDGVRTVGSAVPGSGARPGPVMWPVYSSQQSSLLD